MKIAKMQVCLECQKTFDGRKGSQYCSGHCKFWSLFDKSGGPDACWPWKYGLAPNGYGNVPQKIIGKRGSSHRIAFKLATGSDPGKLCVCHSCDFRACGNPAHLWLGTQRQNMMDAIAKGRHMVIGPGELHPLAKLSEEKVREILQSATPAPVLADRFGVTKGTIYAVRSRRSWAHISLDEMEPEGEVSSQLNAIAELSPGVLQAP